MASGDTYTVLTALSGVPPTTNYATLDLTAENIPVLEFDDATDESYLFVCVMPGQYDGTSALTVRIGWKFATFVGSQTCDWEVAIARCEDDGQSIESLTFAAAQTSIPTEASASGEIDYVDIAFTNAQFDGVQPSEMFVLKVTRDASGGTQGSPGDTQLAFVEVSET